MSSVNKVMLVGNVGKDPEVRAMQNGDKVASFSLATSERWKDKNTGERKERTEWHNVVVFNEGLVRVVEQFVKKGSRLYVEGAIQTRKWQDKDGRDRYSTEVVLQRFRGEIQLLDTRRDDDEDAQPAEVRREYNPIPSGPPPSTGAMINDDIPFAR